jgi:site-specific recombinase XerD
VDHRRKQLTSDKLRHVLIQVAREAGLNGLTRVHDLRHTFNSLLQMRGVDAGTMARILGHQDLQTTMIYTHQTADHLKQAINRLKLK